MKKYILSQFNAPYNTYFRDSRNKILIVNEKCVDTIYIFLILKDVDESYND